MKFKNFEIHAEPRLTGRCPKCRDPLREVPHGWFSIDLFCDKCEKVFELKMVEVTEGEDLAEYIKKCRRDVS